MDSRLAEFYRRAKNGHASKFIVRMAGHQVSNDSLSIRITVTNITKKQTETQNWKILTPLKTWMR